MGIEILSGLREVHGLDELVAAVECSN
jgi:hypothetical protein